MESESYELNFTAKISNCIGAAKRAFDFFATQRVNRSETFKFFLTHHR